VGFAADRARFADDATPFVNAIRNQATAFNLAIFRPEPQHSLPPGLTIPLNFNRLIFSGDSSFMTPPGSKSTTCWRLIA